MSGLLRYMSYMLYTCTNGYIFQPIIVALFKILCDLSGFQLFCFKKIMKIVREV